MRIVDRFRDRRLVESLVQELHRLADQPVSIMEVCGTHTMAVFHHGLRSLLPENINLVSGPGCPVCVTTASEINGCVEISRIPDVTVASFGDLVRVPGSKGSLAEARAEGASVEIVYSPVTALQIAEQDQKNSVVFLAIGFEATASAVAATAIEARKRGLNKFFIFAAHKIMPPALDALMSDASIGVQGLLCPGHVSTIIGTKAYEALVEKYQMPCVVAGFEPADILQGLIMLMRQIKEGRCRVENAYPRAVNRQGNARAQKLISAVFEPIDSAWRGLGIIPKSGLQLRQEFISLDAARNFAIDLVPAPEPHSCNCGSILKGQSRPDECPLFAKQCTPSNPVGPCMVSSEGSCAAYYRYGGGQC